MNVVSSTGNAEQCILCATVAVYQLTVLDLYFIQRTGTSVQKPVAVGLFRIVTDCSDTLFCFAQDSFAGLQAKSGAHICKCFVCGIQREFTCCVFVDNIL